MEMEDLLTMRLLNQLKIHVTQPNDQLSKVLKLEEGKKKPSVLIQNRVTFGWVMQKFKCQKKKVGCGTTRIDRKAIEIYVEILIHIERLHSIESHYMNETRLLWRKHVNKSTQFQELKPTPGLNISKDILGPGANVVGNCKQKLLSVYHCEDPQVI